MPDHCVLAHADEGATSPNPCVSLGILAHTQGIEDASETYFERSSQSPKMEDNLCTEQDIRDKPKTCISSILLTDSQLLHSINITLRSARFDLSLSCI